MGWFTLLAPSLLFHSAYLYWACQHAAVFNLQVHKMMSTRYHIFHSCLMLSLLKSKLMLGVCKHWSWLWKVVLVSPGLRGSETELLDQSDISPKFFIQEHAEVTETSKAFPLSSHEVTSKNIVGVSASLTSRPHEESDDSGESLNVQVSFLFSLTFVF